MCYWAQSGKGSDKRLGGGLPPGPVSCADPLSTHEPGGPDWKLKGSLALTFDFGLSTKIHLGFNLRASVSFPATESSNSHLSLQHLALALVSFYKSGLRKDWISHLIKRDCIACCFLFLFLFPCAQAAFLFWCLVLSLNTRHFRDRQELGSYDIDSQALHQLFHHKQNPPPVFTPASASSILCSSADHNHLEYMITFRNRIPCVFQWMPSQADSIFFTLVERRWVTILKHPENYFCQFFFFFHFTPSVLCSHHHGGFLEGRGEEVYHGFPRCTKSL